MTLNRVCVSECASVNFWSLWQQLPSSTMSSTELCLEDYEDAV